MHIKISKKNETTVAEVESDEVLIRDVQDALDLMADCGYQGARDIILHRKNIIPSFFVLSTGIAGEVLQKFSNYRVRLAIVGDFAELNSTSLRDFIRESNKTGRILFVRSAGEAMDKLTGYGSSILNDWNNEDRI